MKWEYIVKDINGVNSSDTSNDEVVEQKFLDSLGEDGWELVAVAPVLGGNYRRAYLKKRAD